MISTVVFFKRNTPMLKNNALISPRVAPEISIIVDMLMWNWGHNPFI